MNIMANFKQLRDEGFVRLCTPTEAPRRFMTTAAAPAPANDLDDPMLALSPSSLQSWAHSSLSGSLSSEHASEGETPGEDKSADEGASGHDSQFAAGLGSEQGTRDEVMRAIGGGAGPSEPIRVLLADDHVVVRAGICSLLESLDGVEVVGQASNGHEALRLLEARALAAPSRVATDIAILDISMGGMNGLETAAHIVRRHPETRVIMLSMHASEEYVHQALRAGASGYLLKESGFDELEGALRDVARGEKYLSPGVSRHLIDAYISRSNADSFRSSTSHPGHRAGDREESESNTSRPGSPSGEASGDAASEAVVLTPRQQEILRLVAQGLSNGQIASRLSISIKTVETHCAGLKNRLNIFTNVGLVRYAIRYGYIDPL